MACLEETPLYNYQISKKLHISERTFYRIKAQALYKLALALYVEVYEGDEVKSQ